MNYDSLDKELNKGLRAIYLLYGEEQYLIDMAIKKIKKIFGELLVGINYIIIDETNLDNLISEIEVPAFDFDKKLILVKNSELFKKDGRKKTPTVFQEKIGEYISNNLNIIEENVVLVFIEKIADKNSVYDIVERTGIICQINCLQNYQIIGKLKQICSLYKVNVKDLALNYLIEISGNNLQDLINEIRKLVEYVGEEKEITKQEIDLLANKKIESIIFDLTDSLGIKDTKKALNILDDLIYQKDSIQRILVTIYNHFKKIYLCQYAIEINKDVIKALELKSNQTFLVSKYKKQSKYFSREELKNILEEFVNLDYNFKMGQIDLEIGLKSILCRYC